MNIIDSIKDFEQAGFTRKQAEQQVKSMTDLKEGLATSKELNSLRFEIDTSFGFVAKQFKSIDEQFKNIDKRFDLIDKKLRYMPFETTIYQAGMLLLFFGIQKFWPAIFTWLTK